MNSSNGSNAPKSIPEIYHITTPIEIEPAVINPQIYFQWDNHKINADRAGHPTHPCPHCLCCNTKVGQIVEHYWLANIYLGRMRSYFVGYVCDRCLDESNRSDEFGLADKIKQTFTGLLRDFADNMEQAELQINKPTH